MGRAKKDEMREKCCKGSVQPTTTPSQNIKNNTTVASSVKPKINNLSKALKKFK